MRVTHPRTGWRSCSERASAAQPRSVTRTTDTPRNRPDSAAGASLLTAAGSDHGPWSAGLGHGALEAAGEPVPVNPMTPSLEEASGRDGLQGRGGQARSGRNSQTQPSSSKRGSAGANTPDKEPPVPTPQTGQVHSAARAARCDHAL